MNPLLDPLARPVIAHRGAAAHAPENTLAAFEHAVSVGADALELDLRLTRDGEVVVIHDPRVARTTGGTGSVHLLNVAEIRALDAGANFTVDGGRTYPYRGKGVRVPLLEEVLQRFPSTPLVIEVKVPAAAAPTLELLERHGALERTLVGSELYEAVAAFRGRVPTTASRREVLRLIARACLPRVPLKLPYQVLSIPLQHGAVPVPATWLARRIRPAGVLTHVWTVNDESVAAALWAAGIQGIVTDDPERMLRSRAPGSGRRAAAEEPGGG